MPGWDEDGELLFPCYTGHHFKRCFLAQLVVAVDQERPRGTQTRKQNTTLLFLLFPFADEPQ